MKFDNMLLRNCCERKGGKTFEEMLALCKMQHLQKEKFKNCHDFSKAKPFIIFFHLRLRYSKR